MDVLTKVSNYRNASVEDKKDESRVHDKGEVRKKAVAIWDESKIVAV
jgi:hypothetical protein